MTGRWKIWLTITWLTLIAADAKSQSNGMISQYMFNKLLINPAFAGNEEALTFSFLHKDHWTGLKGAPTTSVFAGHSPVNNHVGLGLAIVNDQMGGLNQKGVYGSYAYRIKSPDYIISMGLQAGFTSYRYRPLFLKDEFDPVFEGCESSHTTPIFGTGFYYETRDYYAGFSIPQLFRFDKNEAISYSLQSRSYILHGGYSITLSPALVLNPTGLIYIKKRHKPEINLNVNLLIDRTVWAGVIYRNLNNLGVLGKFQAGPQFSIGYGYDFNMGELEPLSAGSHEIMLQYSFIYIEKNALSPRFF